MIFKISLIFLIYSVFFLNPNITEAKQVQISITNSGYDPQKITIDQNDSVIFQNNSSSSAWPASNIHPSHSIYPEFDPQQEIKPGGNWQFSFTKTGTWRYHDHLYPSKIGDIRVLGNSKSTTPKRQLLSTIDELKIKFSQLYYLLFPQHLDSDFNQVNILETTEYPEITGSWMKLVGVKKILDKLLLESGNGEFKDCHQESHNIGRIAYQLYKASAFKDGSSVCHSGFYHGMIEQFFQDQGSANFAQKVADLCSQFKTSFSKFECLHGIGHGIMAYLDYDLPEAINQCKTLTEKHSPESCFGGVFMENIVQAEGKGASRDHSTNWVNDDPYFPCNAVDQEQALQTQCYLIQTARMLDLNSYQFEKIVPLCQNAPENMRHICFQSLGRDAAGQVLRDPEKILAICQTTPKQYFEDCLKGSLYVILEFWGEKMEDQPHQLCKILDPKDKTFCYQTLGARLKGIVGENPDRINQICQYSEAQFVNDCLAN